MSSLVEFGNGFADGIFVEDLFVVGHATNEKGRGAKAINLPGDTFGVIINGDEGIFGEECANLETKEVDVVAHLCPKIDSRLGTLGQVVAIIAAELL